MQDLPPSPRMTELLNNPGTNTRKRHIFPFETMKPGDTFTVGMNEVKYNTLKVIVYRAGKKHKCRFVMLEHKEQGLYEVGRTFDKVENEAS